MECSQIVIFKDDQKGDCFVKSNVKSFSEIASYNFGKTFTKMTKIMSLSSARSPIEIRVTVEKFVKEAITKPLLSYLIRSLSRKHTQDLPSYYYL